MVGGIATLKSLPVILALLAPGADAFLATAPPDARTATAGSSSARGQHPWRHLGVLAAAANSKAELEPEEVRRLLEEYLEKRVELNADELAKQEKGRVIGGTKGNKILDYVSGAPAKEQVVERIPNIFDYDELAKYGYSNLVTPIMNMGGRRAVYDMMGMEPPPLRELPKKKPPVEIKLDRTGEEDPNRFKGVRMGMLDDDSMGEALARANEKSKRGESLRSKIMEEEFERPFADKRNTGPRQTPDWTPEKIDEYMESRGRSIAGAKQAELENYVKDAAESLDLGAAAKAYLVFALLEVSFAFGRSTPVFLRDFCGMEDTAGFLDVFQAPALALVVASLASAAACGWLLAPPLNRSTGLWAFKGLLGGPLTIAELRGLKALQTGAEALREKLKQDPFTAVEP